MKNMPRRSKKARIVREKRKETHKSGFMCTSDETIVDKLEEVEPNAVILNANAGEGINILHSTSNDIFF